MLSGPRWRIPGRELKLQFQDNILTLFLVANANHAVVVLLSGPRWGSPERIRMHCAGKINFFPAAAGGWTLAV